MRHDQAQQQPFGDGCYGRMQQLPSCGGFGDFACVIVFVMMQQQQPFGGGYYGHELRVRVCVCVCHVCYFA
jgi:hypothetical protein